MKIYFYFILFCGRKIEKIKKKKNVSPNQHTDTRSQTHASEHLDQISREKGLGCFSFFFLSFSSVFRKQNNNNNKKLFVFSLVVGLGLVIKNVQLKHIFSFFFLLVLHIYLSFFLYIFASNSKNTFVLDLNFESWVEEMLFFVWIRSDAYLKLCCLKRIGYSNNDKTDSRVYM